MNTNLQKYLKYKSRYLDLKTVLQSGGQMHGGALYDEVQALLNEIKMHGLIGINKLSKVDYDILNGRVKAIDTVNNLKDIFPPFKSNYTFKVHNDVIDKLTNELHFLNNVGSAPSGTIPPYTQAPAFAAAPPPPSSFTAASFTPGGPSFTAGPTPGTPTASFAPPPPSSFTAASFTPGGPSFTAGPTPGTPTASFAPPPPSSFTAASTVMTNQALLDCLTDKDIIKNKLGAATADQTVIIATIDKINADMLQLQQENQQLKTQIQLQQQQQQQQAPAQNDQQLQQLQQEKQQLDLQLQQAQAQAQTQAQQLQQQLQQQQQQQQLQQKQLQQLQQEKNDVDTASFLLQQEKYNLEQDLLLLQQQLLLQQAQNTGPSGPSVTSFGGPTGLSGPSFGSFGPSFGSSVSPAQTQTYLPQSIHTSPYQPSNPLFASFGTSSGQDEASILKRIQDLFDDGDTEGASAYYKTNKQYISPDKHALYDIMCNV